MTTIRECGLDIPSEVICWCGDVAPYHHVSGGLRRDGKITVWYKCPKGHKYNVDMNYKSIPKPMETKKKEKKPKKWESKENEVQIQQ